MRTLVYGMQSSGASVFTYWLAQQQTGVAVIDLYFDQLAPFIEHENVILKCTATKAHSLQSQIDAFKPDKVILFVRNAVENFLSLSQKMYAETGGTVMEKMELFNQVIAEKKYDQLVRYEDFIARKVDPKLGDESNYLFRKTIDEIKQYNFHNSPWCRDNYKIKWGTGNIHAGLPELKILVNQDQFPNLRNLY